MREKKTLPPKTIDPKATPEQRLTEAVERLTSTNEAILKELWAIHDTLKKQKKEEA